MKWISIDPAKGKTGVAVWTGKNLDSTYVIKPRGNKGNYYCGKEILPSRHEAIEYMLSGTWIAVMELGTGGMVKVAASQGWIRGYIEAIADRSNIPCETIPVSVWRRCIREAYDISWPSTRDRKKALSKKLVKQEYGLDVSDDESDAVLIGVAAMRMRISAGNGDD